MRLSLLAAAAFAVLTSASGARAELPAVATVTSVPVAAPLRAATGSTGSMATTSLMLVLDVLGILEKEAPKSTATPRTPTWLSPEPPKTPLLYSSLVVAKF